jgi:hypothetical protein
MWHLKGYVQNLIWCNEALDDDIRLEGVIQTGEGVSLVISQPCIIGREPTDAEWRHSSHYKAASDWQN